MDVLYCSGSGIGITIDGFYSNCPLDIKWNEIHAIKVWEIAQQYCANLISFKQSVKSLESLASELGLQLHLTDGDVSQTWEVMAKYYYKLKLATIL